MGVYSEYLDRQLSFQDLTDERKRQLRRLSEIRDGRDVLVFAADLNKGQAPIAITYGDLLPIHDQLANLSGTSLDLILETPGGSGEVAEDVVRLLRGKYTNISVIVPGWAKSAGTVMVMAADEIIMGPASGLGPIDAQLSWQGKVFSADALLEGMEKIKKEVEETDVLNKAYIPVLQGISPGELQSAENAMKFAKELVTEWLARYKFSGWTIHSSTKQPVTDLEKRERAEQIAGELCNHRRWLTHGRSIKISDLETMGLRISDFSKNPDLEDAITRYHTLLQMTFATNIYKVFETPNSQVYRFMNPPVPAAQQPGGANVAIIDFRCSQCSAMARIQANLDKTSPLQEGCAPFPPDDKFHCPNCGTEHNLSDARRQIEVQSKKQVVA